VRVNYSKTPEAAQRAQNVGGSNQNQYKVDITGGTRTPRSVLSLTRFTSSRNSKHQPDYCDSDARHPPDHPCRIPPGKVQPS